LIYLIEGKEPFARDVRGELGALQKKHPDLAAALGRLTWLECRVAPMKNGDSATLAAFDAFFTKPDLVWIELSRDVVELAAVIRIKHSLKTPDALQAASCLQLGKAHVFLTGDNAFKRVTGLNVKILS
jgi:predicted nucleic acid-binding protein